MCPSVLDMQQSLPQCWPGGKVAASPHQRGTQQPSTLWRWLHPDLEDAHAEMRSPALPAAQHPGPAASWLRRWTQQQQRGAQASCSSITARAFPGHARGSQQKAGRRRGSEGRNLLPERTGRFHSCGGDTESSPNCFAANSPHVLLEVSTANARRKVQVPGSPEAPWSERREEVKPLGKPGREGWAKQENMG